MLEQHITLPMGRLICSCDTNTTGLQPTIYLNKADTSLMTINWGDGTSNAASGNVKGVNYKNRPITQRLEIILLQLNV